MQRRIKLGMWGSDLEKLCSSLCKGQRRPSKHPRRGFHWKPSRQGWPQSISELQPLDWGHACISPKKIIALFIIANFQTRLDFNNDFLYRVKFSGISYWAWHDKNIFFGRCWLKRKLSQTEVFRAGELPFQTTKIWRFPFISRHLVYSTPIHFEAT